MQAQPFTFTLRSVLTEINYPGFMSTDTSGFFTIDVTALPAGTYSWRLKGSSYLATSGTVTLAGGTTQVEMGLQRVGDMNNDNVCSSLDFTLLKANFGHSGAP
jgi:hypothetical protein